LALVLLSLGSNIDREANIRQAVDELQQHFGPLSLSPVYESTSVGFDGPAFYNLAASLHSDRSPQEISRTLKAIETQLGRSRDGDKFDSRTIDIDLLTYGNRHIDEPGLSVPRAEILEYAFVLKPLADLAGNRIHPQLGQDYASLWQSFKGANTLHRVDFAWQ
jgi:2-amino-4-hydroxy-6-hydroxymethyldihydropteridine diphosphokinase